MARQYTPKIFHDPRKKPPAPLLHTEGTVPNLIKNYGYFLFGVSYFYKSWRTVGFVFD